jgi:hypothetical protein
LKRRYSNNDKALENRRPSASPFGGRQNKTGGGERVKIGEPREVCGGLGGLSFNGLRENDGDDC